MDRKYTLKNVMNLFEGDDTDLDSFFSICREKFTDDSWQEWKDFLAYLGANGLNYHDGTNFFNRAFSASLSKSEKFGKFKILHSYYVHLSVVDDCVTFYRESLIWENVGEKGINYPSALFFRPLEAEQELYEKVWKLLLEWYPNVKYMKGRTLLHKCKKGPFDEKENYYNVFFGYDGNLVPYHKVVGEIDYYPFD